MARQFSPTQFFRRVPKTLLGRYFQEKEGILEDLDFSKLEGKAEDTIFLAFLTLPDDLKSRMEAEFQDIDIMACSTGISALIDEASFHRNNEDSNFPETIAKIDGFHGKVMWTFLEHPNYWTGATLFLHSDNISDSLWKKRNDLPHLPPCVESEDTERLEKAISEYFHTREGRGRNCKVEVFRRNEKEYFFAYPEDYAHSGVEWVSNDLATRSRNPAFEIIFVYTQSEGSLDIYAPRNTKAVPKLQKLFAKSILGIDNLEDFIKDPRVYQLDPLAKRDFIFNFGPESGIEEVAVCKLRLNLKTGDKRRMILEANPDSNPKAVYDFLDDINPPPYHVTQARIKVSFIPTPGTRSRTRSFDISSPNSCALRHDGRDLAIRKMLIASGIEPVSPEPEEKQNAA